MGKFKKTFFLKGWSNERYQLKNYFSSREITMYYPMEDLPVRFEISSNNISRSWITCYDLLHCHFKNHTNLAFKSKQPWTQWLKFYPITRILIDCAKVFTLNVCFESITCNNFFELWEPRYCQGVTRNIITQRAITCSKSKMETPAQYMKIVQS